MKNNDRSISEAAINWQPPLDQLRPPSWIRPRDRSAKLPGWLPRDEPAQLEYIIFCARNPERREANGLNAHEQ